MNIRDAVRTFDGKTLENLRVEMTRYLDKNGNNEAAGHTLVAVLEEQGERAKEIDKIAAKLLLDLDLSFSAKEWPAIKEALNAAHDAGLLRKP
jgi:hypothetical protein